MGISATHLLIVLLIVLIIFGAGKLPNVMADIGRGVKSFKKVLEEKDDPGTEPPKDRTAIEGEIKKEVPNKL